MKNLLTFLLLCFATYTPATTADIRDYLFRNTGTGELAVKVQQLSSELMNRLDNEDVENAYLTCQELRAEISVDTVSAARPMARIMNNIAIVLAIRRDDSQASAILDDAISLVEQTDLFDADLFNMMMIKAILLEASEDLAGAEDALRRAQHITHRQGGVYSRQQLPVLDSLTLVQSSQGNYLSADLQQRFNLKVSEQTFGARSEALTPTLQKIGAYLANRAVSLPKNTDPETRLYRDNLFRESVHLFERSISILEDKYGDNDLRLIAPLKGLSRTRYLQGTSRALTKEPMERALGIVRNNPSTDVADRARALVELADVYIVTGDARAGEIYTEAWNLLSDVAYSDLRYQFFGKPIRLEPEFPIQPTLSRHPFNVEPGQELFVDLAFDIRTDGRVNNVKIIEGNVPNNQKKLMRDYVSTMKYRPRMVEGQFAVTEGLDLHQTFKVVERIPTTSISISTGPQNF